MKNFRKNIWLITACVMVLGLILGAIGFFCGGAKSLYINQGGIHVSDKTQHNLENLNLKAFQSIGIDVQDFDVEFMPSQNYGIYICYYGDTCHPTYTVENGTLKVTDGTENSFGGLDFNFFNKPNKIRIYLPANAALNAVKIKSACGNVIAGNFSAQTTDISSSSGYVNVSGISGDTLTLSASCGNIDIKNANFKSLSANDSSGNVTLKDSTASQTSGILQCGNITIRGSKLGSTNLDTQSGDIDAINVTTAKLSAKCSCGNMKLSGNLGGKTDLQSSSGNIDFSTGISKSQYSYSLSANDGNIKVNGSKDAPHVKEKDGAANSLTASASCGNINADFQE